MILHPVVSDIASRLDRISDAIRKGSLTPGIGRYMSPGWAYLYKDAGTPHLAFAKIGSGLDDYTGSEDEDRALAYVVTTDDEDRDGDIVRPMGAQLKNYSANPLVFFGHQEWVVPIGVCRSPDGRITVYPEENRMVDVIYFDTDSDSDLIYTKCRKKILNATSIAFVPIEAWKRDDVQKARTHSQPMMPPGWYFNQWDKTEVSIVGVPSNPKAVGLEKDLQGACRDVFDKERGHMSPRLRKAWQRYCAVEKGCWGGWCPLPGDEKDIGGGVVLKAVNKSGEPDLSTQVQRAGEELAAHTDPAPMPGYGQIYSKDGELWYVGGDGDDDGFSDLVEERLGSISGVTKITYEAEGFPPGREEAGWTKLYPLDEVKAMKKRTRKKKTVSDVVEEKAVCSCDDCSEGKPCQCAKGVKGQVDLKSEDVKKGTKGERTNLHQVAYDFGVDDNLVGFMDWLGSLGLEGTDLDQRELQQAYYRGRDSVKSLAVAKMKVEKIVEKFEHRYGGHTIRTERVSSGWHWIVDDVGRSSFPVGSEDEAVEAAQVAIDRGGKKQLEEVRPSGELEEQKAQPSEDIDPEKACQILRDGEVNGHKLTEDQRSMFGAACSRKKSIRFLGGYKGLPVYKLESVSV